MTTTRSSERRVAPAACASLQRHRSRRVRRRAQFIVRSLLALGLASSPLTADEPAAAEADPYDPWVRALKAQEAAAAPVLDKARRQTLAGRPGSALRTYESVVKRFRRTEAAAIAQLAIADLYRENREYRNAFDAYQVVIDHFRSSELFAPALDGQVQIATTVLKTHQRNDKRGKRQPKHVLPRRDTLGEMLKNIIANGPYADSAPTARYLLAVNLEASGKLDDAVEAHQTLLDLHPRHQLADDAAFQTGYIHLRKNRAPIKDTLHWTNARTAFLELLTNFPESPKAPLARHLLKQIESEESKHLLQLARFYEKTRKPAAAQIYYRTLHASYPSTPAGKQAAKALARLQPPSDSAPSPQAATPSVD